jgi:hypothetical protein
MRLSGNAGAFQPQNIRVVLGAQPRTFEQVCVQFRSRDGRYFAEGHYQVASGSVSLPRIEFHTRYQHQLKEYASSDMAISVTSGIACDDSRQFFPIKYAKTEATPQLVVQVRAGDARVYAQFGHEGMFFGPKVLCTKLTGSTVAFTHECALPLQDASVREFNDLTIAETDSKGDIVPKLYSVTLPQLDKGVNQ